MLSFVGCVYVPMLSAHTHGYRFLPDKAIDLIDEAGSRVRLRHAALPEEARDLDKELRALLKEKDAAVRCAFTGRPMRKTKKAALVQCSSVIL